MQRALATDWRDQALRALPAVGAWEPDADDVLARAEPLMRHEFDLLGSGPTPLGPEIDWHTDFKSGRSWPLVHVSKVPISYPDDSDIKVPWELSRCQHLPILAAAHRASGEQRHLDEIGAQMTSFIESNPVEMGPCWACTMDVAIRATNWVATLALVPDQEWTGRVLQSLYLHGRFIRSHLEWGEVRGNHYLSDIAGLLPVAALFPNEGWQQWAARELVSEMEHQVRADGVDHEMSTSYHRLVTELFVRGTEAARALGQSFPGWYDERLALMREFISAYTRPDGLAPLVGDEDSGRFLPLGDYGRDPRDHSQLAAEARTGGLQAFAGSGPQAFAQGGSHASAGAGAQAFADGGFYVFRRGHAYVLVRCGDTGLHGLGGHAHNDQLSFELCVGDQPLIVDPGAYVYTADPEARNLFRSTRSHSTLTIDGREQNELRSDYLFTLPDQSRAEAISFDDDSFEGQHHGFAPAVHRRRIEILDAGVAITDTIESSDEHEVEWTLPLAPGAESLVTVEADGVDFAPERGWYSPAYGVRTETTYLRARRRSRPGSDQQRIVVTFKGRAA